MYIVRMMLLIDAVLVNFIGYNLMMMQDFGSHNELLYTMYDAQRQAMQPFSHVAAAQRMMLKGPAAYNSFFRKIDASAALFERFTKRYTKPEFRISSTDIDGKTYSIHQEIIHRRAFGTLIRFRAPDAPDRPKMLVVPPLSGHYSTLVRGTVEGLLQHSDVYIIDWHNARDIPISEGKFHFDDFVRYCIEFMTMLGPDLHVLAVCQPSVPVLAAVAVLSAKAEGGAPLSLTMMGGPVDTRENPTKVNEYAMEKTIGWFQKNVITRVPLNYSGAGRLVYPGFMQLFGFISMNLNTHMNAHADLYRHLVLGDGESVASHTKFYDEYLSVMDLPAEFYLETVQHVFQEYSLPRGTLQCLGEMVDLNSIEKTSLMCIEGGRDDISGIGQTKAALTLCKGLADERKHYHLQKNVGHYGIFNGRRYREYILPEMVKFMHAQEKKFGSSESVIKSHSSPSKKVTSIAPASKSTKKGTKKT